MQTDVRVFGRPASSAVAKDVMAAPTMHQTPAPAQPADVVENPALAGYYNALDACYDIARNEKDPLRLLRVEESRAFFEGVIAQYEEPDTTAQPPAPAPTPPPMPAAPGAMGPPGGPPAPVADAGATGGSLPDAGPVPSATTPPAA